MRRARVTNHSQPSHGSNIYQFYLQIFKHISNSCRQAADSINGSVSRAMLCNGESDCYAVHSQAYSCVLMNFKFNRSQSTWTPRKLKRGQALRRRTVRRWTVRRNFSKRVDGTAESHVTHSTMDGTAELDTVPVIAQQILKVYQRISLFRLR